MWLLIVSFNRPTKVEFLVYLHIYYMSFGRQSNIHNKRHITRKLPYPISPVLCMRYLEIWHEVVKSTEVLIFPKKI